MSDFGGGSLESPRRWVDAQWLGLTLGVPSCTGHQARTEKAQGASWGAAKAGALTVLPRGALLTVLLFCSATAHLISVSNASR